MPLYDFRFSDRSGAVGTQRHAFRALDFKEAKSAALSWAREWLCLSDQPASHAPWMLVIATGEDTEEYPRGTAIFAQPDVKPAERTRG